jgi:protease YdgD
VNDIALLVLDRPIRGNGVTPFVTAGKPRNGDPVSVVSYAVNREERPSFEDACKVLSRPADMIVISCSVDFGASGAPILSFADGQPRIVSVVSAKAESMGRPVALGVDIDGSIDMLIDLAHSRPALSPRRAVMVRGTGSAAQAAKFVRP